MGIKWGTRRMTNGNFSAVEEDMIGICLPRIAASCSRILGNASCRQIAIGHSEPVVNNINFCRPQTPQNCRDSWTRDRWLARPMPGATDSEMVTRPVAKNNSPPDRPSFEESSPPLLRTLRTLFCSFFWCNIHYKNRLCRTFTGDIESTELQRSF